MKHWLARHTNHHTLLSIGLVAITWALLLWLNFAIVPNVFAHLVAIPSLFVISAIWGVNALKCSAR